MKKSAGFNVNSSKILRLCSAGRDFEQHVSALIDINGTAVDHPFFTAIRRCKVVAIKATPAVAGTDAGAVSATVTRCQGTEAPASGDDLIGTTKINLKGTAHTVQSLVLTTTLANLILEVGDRLAVDVTGTLTAVVCNVTVLIAYMPS